MSTSSSLAFDDVVIDFAGRRLLRGGVQQALEPKAFGVLTLLAGTPGRVFTRDEILDAVWGHRHITPGVLNRVVTLLRQALGEDAQNPRLLRTVHGVGYRFDLPAAVVPVGATVDEAQVPLPVAREEPLPPQPVTPDSAPRVAPVPVADPVSVPRRGPQPLVWVIPLLVVLALAGWWLWPRAADTSSLAVQAASEALPATPTLVVLPLKAIGESEDTKVIAEGLSEELIGSLARIDGLRVIASESTRLAAAETSDPAQLAQRLGITHSLEGSLQQSGQSLRIRLRLLDARGGALWAKDFDRDASEVLQLQRDVAQQVADSLALKMGLAGEAMPKGGDAEFLRRLLAAEVLYQRFDLPPEASLDPAERELRALLRERPDDARVHAALAAALNIHSFRRPDAPPAIREEAVREAIVTQRLDPSLPISWFILASEACSRNEWERCLTLFRESDARGMQAAPVFDRAVLLVRLGYLDQAEALAREQLVRDPLNGNRNFTLGRVLDTRGRHDEASEHLQRERAGNNPAYGRWFNAVWRHDYAGALAIAEQEIGERDASYGALLRPGYVAAARALVDPSLWPQALAAAEIFERRSGRMNFVRLLAPDAPEHAAEFIRKLDLNRVNFASTWDLLLWTKELAYLRRDPAFQDYLRESGILDYWRQHGFPEQCHPQGDGAACD